MSIEQQVRDALAAGPVSGGRLVERLQAEGVAPPRPAVLVYGALANLRAKGEAEVVARGPGEVVWGRPGATPPPPAPPGHPPSFALGAADLALLERHVWQLTKGLPGHYFEELRRVVVADADRRVFHGDTLPRALTRALAELGPPSSARRFLRRVERGGPVALRLPAPRRWLLVPAVLLVVVVCVRLFVVGLYTMPDESVSMAPTLFPAREGGDRWVLAWLSCYRFGLDGPARGDVVVFRLAGRRDPLVKRVFGLPGETIALAKGDVLVNGERLVKERPLLDRVRVPLFDLDDLEPGERPGERRLAAGRWHVGYRLPDGAVNHRAGRCPDVVLEAAVRGGTGPGSATFSLDAGRGRRLDVTLRRDESGLREGFVAHDGVEVARAPALTLQPGATHRLWITNADGCFRVEIDGREIVRRPLPPGGPSPEVRVVTENAEVASLVLARDLVHERLSSSPHEWTLGDGELFLLGDNAPMSRDSRAFGPVRRDAVLGRVFLVAWPPSRARAID